MAGETAAAVEAACQYLGHVNKIVAATQWAEATANGEYSSQTVTRAEDLDLDGEDEYIIHSDEVFAVLENGGGRVEYAFAWSAEVGPVQLIAPHNQKLRLWGQGDYHTVGEIGFIAGAVGGTDAAFFDVSGGTGEKIISAMATTVSGNSLEFETPDGKLTKRYTLSGDTLAAAYSLTGIDSLGVNFCFTTNMAALLEREWKDNFEPVESANFSGWQTSVGGYAGVNEGGLELKSFLDSPAATEMYAGEDPNSYTFGHYFPFPWGCTAIWTSGTSEFDVSITLRASSNIMP